MEPRNLVCARCWRDFFDTESFEKFCTIGDPDTVVFGSVFVQAITTIDDRRNAASSGCNWCSYIASLLDCKLPGERLLKVWLAPSIHKAYTPKGLNIFHLSLKLSRPWHLGSPPSQIHAFTTKKDIASKYITARPLRTDVGTEAAARQMQAWLKECRGHGCCSGSRKESILPTRIIEVSPPDEQGPRLIEAHGLRGVYTTISYCWGKVPFQTLNKSNYTQLAKGLDMESLPLTVQDAITTTRRLSISYIWIDALCIIQDSDEDQSREVALMKDIYASSTLTIVAASTKDVYEGFLSNRSYSEDLFQIPVRIQPGLFGTMYINDLAAATYHERFEPLAKRAWTLQEQLLSQRTITFSSHTMIWACKAGTKNFGDSLYFAHDEERMKGPSLRRDHDLNLNTLLVTNQTEESSSEMALSRWMRLVMAYSLRSLSFEHDKLNAIAGIASHPSFVSGLGPRYFAGIWEYELARQLTWYPKRWYKTLPKGEKFTFYRPTSYRAPSWSWASVEGGFIYFDSLFNYEQRKTPDIICEIMECSVTPRFPEQNPLGEVISAHLRVKASLRTAWFDPQTSNVMLFHTPNANSQDGEMIARNGAWKQYVKDYMARFPTIDVTRNPGGVHGSNRDNFHGICDESDIYDPMIVSCLPVSLDETIICGVVGLLLVDMGGGLFKRVGLFIMGWKEDFENVPRREITIL